MNEGQYPATSDLSDFWRLVQASCNGTLLPAERDQLESMLQSDAELKNQYVAYLGMHAELQWRFRGGNEVRPGDHHGPAIAPALDLSPAVVPLSAETDAAGLPQLRFFPLGTNWASFAFLSMLAVLVGIVGTEMWWWHRKDSMPRVAQQSPVMVAPAAYLTSANGCAWGGDATKTWTVGHSVESGTEISLHQGIAEFCLSNGVSFGVEGPASLLLASPSKLVLQYGKLTAHVPWGSEDFKVVTASCRIISRNGEFGINATGSRLDIHAFSGEVTAVNSMIASEVAFADRDPASDLAPDKNANIFAVASVTAGRALRLSAQGEILKVVGWDKAKPGAFVAKLSMSGALPVTQEYVDQIKSSKPVGYWRFEQIGDLKVKNEIDSATSLVFASDSDASGNGAARREALIAASRSSLVGGGQNYSLELRPDSMWHLKGDGRIAMGGAEYSIEAWLKPSHVHLGSVISLESGWQHRSAARIELQGGLGDSFGQRHSGELRYVHRTPQDKPGEFGVSCFSPTPYAVRRWQHVVAVKTKSEMKLYLNGKLISSASESCSLPSDLAVKIGQFGSSDRRKFIGQIDELAIYDHALPDREISQHYRTLKRAMEVSRSSEVAERPDRKQGDS